MVMMGEYFQKELPFKDIYLHALVRDENGDKMSKSKGNVIDPLDMIEKYSADALRFTLAVLAVQGRDIRLSEEKLELSRNFTNKLHNISKYLLMNSEKFGTLEDTKIETPLGKYLLSRFSIAVSETQQFLDQYRFNDSANRVYKFLWDEFANWGVELSKTDKSSIPELGAIFREGMKLLHPFMPFITESIYQELGGESLESSEKSIVISKFPEVRDRDLETEKIFETIIEAIVSIRRLKATVDLGDKKIDEVSVKFDNKISENIAKPYIEKLAKVENVLFVENDVEKSFSDIGDGVVSYISAKSLDLKPILKRFSKQSEKLEKEIMKLEKMLGNERFVANAPESVIRTNRKGLTEAKDKLSKILAEKEKLESI
jgi:valyl-tRNA synthetase